MKKIRLISFLTLIAMALPLMTLAQRNISLSLSKKNLEAGDNLSIKASFQNFDNDLVTGKVYADILDADGVIMDSVVMTKNHDGVYECVMTVPGERFVKHDEIKKLCQYLTIENNNVCGEGFPAILIVDGEIVNPVFAIKNGYPKAAEREKEFTTLHQGYIDDKIEMSAGSYKAFTQIPISSISRLRFTGVSNPHIVNPPGVDRWGLIVETDKNGNSKHFYTVQITATTESGESVAALETISVHQIKLEPYLAEKE